MLVLMFCGQYDILYVNYISKLKWPILLAIRSNSGYIYLYLKSILPQIHFTILFIEKVFTCMKSKNQINSFYKLKSQMTLLGLQLNWKLMMLMHHEIILSLFNKWMFCFFNDFSSFPNSSAYRGEKLHWAKQIIKGLIHVHAEAFLVCILAYVLSTMEEFSFIKMENLYIYLSLSCSEMLCWTVIPFFWSIT